MSHKTAHKILIVDDNATTRGELVKLLADAGFETMTAATVPEAMRALTATPPHLLITEIRLDSYNGLHLIAMAPKPIPAIVITGYADPVLEAEARRGGAEYLVKPFDPERLLTMIREKLGAAPPSFAVPRRWRRKAVAGLTAQVDDQPARIVDVSYGGVKFEIRPPDSTVPESFLLRLSNLALQADLVWKSMLNDDVWVCGAAVWPEESSARQWFGLVDTVY